MVLDGRLRASLVTIEKVGEGGTLPKEVRQYDSNE